MSAKSPAERQLRIVQVMASGPGSGGIEKHFFDLCNRLSLAHTVIAVSHPAYRNGLRAGVQFESLGQLIGRRNPATVLRLLWILRKWRPDVVHAHASRAAAIVLQASPLSPAVRVATVHGLKRSPLVFRAFDRVIAVSRGVAHQLPGVRADIIYNGIAMPRITPPGDETGSLDCEFTSGRPVAVSVGRLDRVKGFDILIDAWQGIDADLLIVGDGPQRRTLELLIADRRLDDRVRLLGYRHDVPDLLARADLSVIASRREGFGYTLAEALLLRRLVVATDVPAANEILPRPFLVPCEDVVGLRTAIRRTLQDPVAATALFVPVWEQAAAVFTIDSMVAATAALYRDAIASPARRKTA